LRDLKPQIEQLQILLQRQNSQLRPPSALSSATDAAPSPPRATLSPESDASDTRPPNYIGSASAPLGGPRAPSSSTPPAEATGHAEGQYSQEPVQQPHRQQSKHSEAYNVSRAQHHSNHRLFWPRPQARSLLQWRHLNSPCMTARYLSYQSARRHNNVLTLRVGHCLSQLRRLQTAYLRIRP
jgi:hypothetical protein